MFKESYCIGTGPKVESVNTMYVYYVHNIDMNDHGVNFPSTLCIFRQL